MSILLAGNFCNIKGNGQTWTEQVGLTVSGTNALPILHQGYNLKRGDNPIDSTRPLLDRGAVAGDGFFLPAANIARFVQVTNAGEDGFNGFGRIEYCRSYSNTGDGIDASSGFTSFASELDLNTGNGHNGSTIYGFDSYYHDNTAGGVQPNGNGGALIFCIVAANGGHGGQGIAARSCTINGNTGSNVDGLNDVRFNSSNDATYNNILSNNARYGLDRRASENFVGFQDYNCFFGNGTAALNGGGWPVGSELHSITTDPTFVGAATQQKNFVSGDITGGATDTITITSHGFTNGYILSLTTTGSLAGSGLAIGTRYFVISATANDFQLSTTRGGAKVELTSAGSGTHTARVFGIGSYALDTGSGCRNTGHPGVFPGNAGTGYMDIGAVRHQDPAGGGSTTHGFGFIG
jgi:hypothetical protein